MKNMTVSKYIALLLKLILAAVVFVFLGSESLNFFSYVFPPEQWFMAYTGFGLTSAAMLVYLFLFIKDAETELQRTISLVMIAVGLIGELFTAGFGMQVESWSKAGFALTESDFTFMIWVVRILMFFHAGALILYFAGDKVGAVFDKDGNGIPDFLEKPKPFNTFGANSEIAQLKAENERLKAEARSRE